MEEEFEEYFEQSNLKRKILAVILILLFGGFSLIGGYAGYVYISYLYGTDVVDGVALKDDVTYSFEVWDEIREIYLQERTTEFVLCLFGDVSQDQIIIDEYSVPETFSRGFAHVRYAGCDDAIATLHSHPNNRCAPSSTDRNTLESEGHPVGFVMCGKDRVGIY